MKTQYISNSHQAWFVIENSEPLIHEDLKSHLTYEGMVFEVAESTECDYEDLLHMEFTITVKGSDLFTMVDDRGFGDEYEDTNLLDFIVQFEN